MSLEPKASFAVDLTNCDREPIHIPGSIQPHGVLLALREPDLIVTHASESVASHLGCSTSEVLGTPLHEVIDSSSALQVRSALASPKVGDVNPIDVRARGAHFDGIVHRHGGVAILELEPRPEQLGGGSHRPLRLALADLQSAETVAALGQSVVQTVRNLTGFERVMLYRFDEDGHGSVDAESVAPGFDPYLLHRYPASDIPRQARALYLRNWLRIIPDARYTPSPIVPSVGPNTGRPLDLSFSVLRSVSPIHLEYLANMGVRASMSVSLIVRGALWGLISCVNHTEPRPVAYEVRSACESIGRLVSLQIAALDEHERARLREARRATLLTLSAAMHAGPGDDVLGGLLAQPAALLSLVDAGGAAILVDGRARSCGGTPSESLLGAIASWLERLAPEEPFATSSLATSLAEAAAAKDVASGLLTIALPGTGRRLIWFRPELVHEVVWGGDPHKPAAIDPQLRMHPRKSFENWKEEVRLHARRWTAADLEAAEDLRRTAVEIDLCRQLDRAERAVRMRDDLVAIVSHDLRNPLFAIQLQTAKLLRSSVPEQDDAARGLRSVAESVQRSADMMSGLITDLLDLAKIEAGRFDLETRHEKLHELVDEALILLRPLAQAKKIELVHERIDLCAAHVDRKRMFQVLSNLIGNALQHTPEGGKITVETRRTDDEQWVEVSDTGPGIPQEVIDHVFDRYWQAPAASRATGSGLGLYITKGIVEAHGGRIWVERAMHGGARFTFALPCIDSIDSPRE
jgi:two-component system, chemotaxis family, sensor kinase Cph1